MVCHVLSNRVLEMGRYVKRDPDVTVSQEIIGTMIIQTPVAILHCRMLMKLRKF